MFRFFSKQPKNWIAEYKLLCNAQLTEEWFLSGKKRRLPIEEDKYRTISSYNQEGAVPKILWLFWGQGWEAAPKFPRLCLEQWQNLNPDWDIRALDQKQIALATDLDVDFYKKKFSWQACSDIFRMALLRKYGGVWSDATIWCARPLNEWLPMVTNSGFFAFSFHDSIQNRPIASWFLAAVKNNALVRILDEKVREFVDQEEKLEHYYWFHILFLYLYKNDKIVNNIWNLTPKISAILCAAARIRILSNPSDEEKVVKIIANLIKENAMPIHKFASQEKIPDSFPDTILALALGRDHL